MWINVIKFTASRLLEPFIKVGCFLNKPNDYVSGYLNYLCEVQATCPPPKKKKNKPEHHLWVGLQKWRKTHQAENGKNHRLEHVSFVTKQENKMNDHLSTSQKGKWMRVKILDYK